MSKVNSIVLSFKDAANITIAFFLNPPYLNFKGKTTE